MLGGKKDAVGRETELGDARLPYLSMQTEEEGRRPGRSLGVAVVSRQTRVFSHKLCKVRLQQATVVRYFCLCG